MAEEKLINLSATELHGLIKNKLMAAGLPQEHAQETANHLTYADLAGFHSHGAVRVEYYSERINKGGINLNPDTSFEQTGPSSGIFHGDNAQGHYISNLALDPAIEMAKESGIAVVGVSKIGHAGTLAYYLDKIVKEDLVALAVTNSDPMVVPFGGSENYYGTNPIGFCAPSDDKERPIIFDMATTVQAWGKILDARSKGKSIPDTWAVDQNGKGTTDPNQVAGLLPIAGPKGYGLMMIVDVLSAVLLGLPNGKHVSSMYHDLTQGRDLGLTYIIIDPERFAGLDNFKKQISQSEQELQSIKPAEGFDRVYYPGEIMLLEIERTREEGVDIPESIVDYLRSDIIHNDAYEGLGAFAN